MTEKFEKSCSESVDCISFSLTEVVVPCQEPNACEQRSEPLHPLKTRLTSVNCVGSIVNRNNIGLNTARELICCDCRPQFPTIREDSAFTVVYYWKLRLFRCEVYGTTTFHSVFVISRTFFLLWMLEFIQAKR